MSTFPRRGWLAALLALCTAACAAGPVPATLAQLDPVGQYQIKGQTVSKNRTYTGELKIEPNGPGFALAWHLDHGDIYRGTALVTGNVLGAVYWDGSGPGHDLGIVVYRIDGGILRGTWMLAAPKITTAGREDLKGSEDLQGRYEVILGQNPEHHGRYGGYVEIDHNGPTYELRWFVPALAFVGKGVRVGDVLVVGYSSTVAPGVIAYCLTKNGGAGVWSHGRAEGLGAEVIARDGTAIGDLASGQPDCKGAGSQAQAD